MGVDGRFTRSLDDFGYGRYVPTAVREHVYQALPSSLDKVQAQTDAPIRIYNRQGHEFFDSRRDARSAGQALSEAREQPLSNLEYARQVRDSYRKQLKVADAIDQYRIYHQKDPQGLPWRYDPEQPQQGWVSELPALPGGFRAPIADAALQNRLDYQASGKATELRMAQPGELPDPYKQPAGPQDRPRMQAASWTRDSQTHAWTREVITNVVDRTVLRETETASPPRAAELDKAAEQTVAQNRTNSPQGVAATYQTMYEQRGWNSLGPMPEAVTSTLREADRTVRASDGHTYSRAADGQWSTPGMLYGRHAAEGNVRDELDATAALPPKRLDNPSHPDHSFYLQTREKVQQLDRELGRTPDRHTDQISSALTVQARADGLHRIDQVALGAGGEKLWAVQTPHGRTDHLFDQRTSVPTASANMPMEQSAAQWPQAMQQFQESQQQTQAQGHAQAQQQGAHVPAMSR